MTNIIKACAVSGKEFVIDERDQAFYAKIGVPHPTLCPNERLRRRTAWRNERNLFKRKCSATDKPVISAFSEECPFPIYDRSYWWSDKWEPLDYGRDFDFSRSFFEQFIELQAVVPQLAIINDDGVGSENCAYCYDVLFSKDCYMAVGMWQARDCYYTTLCDYGIDLVDCDSVYKSELSYECLYSKNLYRCAFLETSVNCSECWFGLDLVGCKNCFGCYGLRQKEYYIFNKPHSKKEYEQKIAAFKTDDPESLSKLRAQWEEFTKNAQRPAVHQMQCENSTGDMMYNCKETEDSYRLYNAEYCRYYHRGDSPKNCYDLFSSGNGQWCYESNTPDNSWMTMFTTWCWKCKEVIYSDNCHSCENLIGCIGLKRKNFCILNKQYSEAEYNLLKKKIIEHMKQTGEWGEFFPVELSPFSYNDSVAFDYFPETESAAKNKNWKWRNKEGSHQKFKVQPREAEFYKKMNLPIPLLHPEERRKKRLKQRFSFELYSRDCNKCQKPIQTVFRPEREEKILCKSCYQEITV